MMKEVARVDGRNANAIEGRVVWSPRKSLWNSTMLATALIAGPFTVTWGAFLMFLAATYLSLLLGHSVGMHRRLIHVAIRSSMSSGS
jgi:hypothetical protein